MKAYEERLWDWLSKNSPKNARKIYDYVTRARKNDCCVSRIGCLCKNKKGLSCDYKKCQCPEHYAKHEEWLKELLKKRESTLREVMEAIAKERDTWASESIGDRALQSFETIIKSKL